MSLLSELRRRNVIRMAGLYLVAAWLFVQVAETLLPVYDAPGWVMKVLVALLAIGFLPALVFAWVFELTPEGLKRDKDVPPEASIALQTGRRMDRMLVAGMVLVVALIVADRLWPESPSTTAPDAAVTPVAAPIEAQADASAHSIAVLPFVDMSQAKDQEYFSDGLSEELLNLLAQLPQLRVIARTSSFSFKGKDVDVATIAQALEVAYVLEGSVRKSGNTLRVTAQLIRASDSTHLWSQTFDRELTDVFAVQDEIAGAVVDALKVKLLPDQQISHPARSANAEAYNEYLIGEQANRELTLEGWARAEEAFRRAIAIDPDYAVAYVGLGTVLGSTGDLLGDQAKIDEAFAVVETALRLDPGLAAAYARRASLRGSYRYDFAGAKADLDKALSLAPGDASLQLSWSNREFVEGRVASAIAAGRQAVDTDPLNAVAWAQLGRKLVAAGDLAGGRAALERAQQINPAYAYNLFHLGTSWLLDGRPEQALAIYSQSESGYGAAGRAMAEASLGHDDRSREILEAAIAFAGNSAAYQIAEVYAWRREPDLAFEWIERSIAQNDGGIQFMKCDPLMDNVRDDPRFDLLLAKANLPVETPCR